MDSVIDKLTEIEQTASATKAELDFHILCAEDNFPIVCSFHVHTPLIRDFSGRPRR